MSIQLRRETEKQHLKDCIIESAIELAKDSGWAKVSVRKISQRINYSTIVIYSVFGSKDELFLALRQKGFDLLLADIKKVHSKFASPKEALLNITHEVVRFHEANTELYQIMFGVVGISGVSDICRDASVSIESTEYIKTIISEILPGDQDSLFFNWWALIRGFIGMIEQMKMESRDAMNTYFDEAMNRFMNN